ncbi:MAG: hypothetical protein [Microvirus sp.]|nr:MAG: hypothetical protein [Microvirus sp.]
MGACAPIPPAQNTAQQPIKEDGLTVRGAPTPPQATEKRSAHKGEKTKTKHIERKSRRNR